MAGRPGKSPEARLHEAADAVDRLWLLEWRPTEYLRRFAPSLLAAGDRPARDLFLATERDRLRTPPRPALVRDHSATERQRLMPAQKIAQAVAFASARMDAGFSKKAAINAAATAFSCDLRTLRRKLGGFTAPRRKSCSASEAPTAREQARAILSASPNLSEQVRRYLESQ
jgi:hypothetical protein